MIISISFLLFTGLVAIGTWFLTRRADHASSTGYFLAGRSLTFPFIAGSLLLTNLSTEQMVGLNGAAYSGGLSVMVWEVVAVLALVAMALFFLPRFLKSGVTTVPEYLNIRFDRGTASITNFVFLTAYATILLPIILYTGATGMMGILDVPSLLGMSEGSALWLIVFAVGIIGSLYALVGGLHTVAMSDTLNGIGLLVGGLLVTGFGLSALGGEAGVFGGLQVLQDQTPERINSIGGADASVPVGTIFSGVLLLNLFYWCTNQQIIQRTFGASSLAEGQKGVLLTGLFKLLGPLYLVLPGMIAFALFADDNIKADHAYGMLVHKTLPASLSGFMAAVMMGAILSSFNSALNSTCTLFSLGVYRPLIKPEASDAQVVASGRRFGVAIAIAAMVAAPFLAQTGSIFGYLQKMNGIYFIPILSVVVVGMLSRRVPPQAAKIALVAGCTVIAAGYFLPPFDRVVKQMNEFHFLGIVFSWLVLLMLVIGECRPLSKEWEQEDCGAVDMTPWRHARMAGCILVALVLLIYISFADFSVV